jgi:uncharacterized protein (TIGR02145 family)
MKFLCLPLVQIFLMSNYLISILLHSILSSSFNLQTKLPIKSVVIGEQEWMSENLSVVCYRNGDTIPYVSDSAAWCNTKSGAWCYLDNDAKNGKTYGKLYNWFALNDPRGLAPEGWHIPTDLEWTTLITHLGGTHVAGGKLKMKTGWEKPNTGATNETGFNGLPGGRRDSNGPFHTTSIGQWWTSSVYSRLHAHYIGLRHDGIGVERQALNKKCALSIRCIKD